MLRDITDLTGLAGRHPYWATAIVASVTVVGLGTTAGFLLLLSDNGFGVIALMGYMLMRSAGVFIVAFILITVFVPLLTLSLSFLITNLINKNR